MLKILITLITISVMSLTKNAYAQTISVYFKTDSFAVNQGNSIQLADFANAHSGNLFRFEIAGRTDDEGNSDYNKQLSLKRALSVKQFLIARGIDTTNLVLTGYGERKPIADNKSETGKAINRSVSITVSRWDQRLSALINDSLKTEEFDFHTKEGYTKKLNDCCSMTFKPFAFVDSSGKELSGNVKLKVTYYNTALDAIKSNISMQSKIAGKEIVYKSHLMFKTEAFYKGRPLHTVYKDFVSVDCECEALLKNSDLFTLDDGNRFTVDKEKKVKAVVETPGEKPKTTTDKAPVEPEKAKPDTPVIVSGSGGGGKSKDTCMGVLPPCTCVDKLAGIEDVTSFSNSEWFSYSGKQKIHWDFPPVYPGHLDSIVDFNERYKSLLFSRQGYITKNMNDDELLTLKMSVQEKGFFKKKLFLKFKAVNLKRFPELKPLQKQFWKMKAGDLPYSEKEFKKKRFSDVRITKEADHYVIELKEKEAFVSINAAAVDKTLREDYDAYRNELDRLSKKVSDSLRHNLQDLEKQYKSSWCGIWHCYKILFPELEKEMDLAAWRNYVYRHKTEFYNTLTGLYEQKAMALTKFCGTDTSIIICPHKIRGQAVGLGTLNIDEVLEVKDSIKKVSYVFENGKKAFIKQVYIYHKLNRTIVNVEDVNEFRCNFYDQNAVLFLLDYKDRQFLLTKHKPITVKNNTVELTLSECKSCLDEFKGLMKR